MNSRTNVLGQAIRYALVAGTAGLMAAPAMAQDSTNTTNLDRIEITGSRIRQVDVETAQPVFAIRERADQEIVFPRVTGYRRELPEERLVAEFSDDSTLVIHPLLKLTKTARGEITAEGAGLLRLVVPGATHDIRIEAA